MKNRTTSVPPHIAAHRASLQRLAVDDGHIAFLDLGSTEAAPVLLVHGIPTSSWLYRSIAPKLAANGVRAIAPDLLGYGASDKPKGREVYSPRRQADRLVALLDHLELPQATFVVHDAGGPWSFEIVDSHPERVAGLVVLNTTAYAEGFTPPRDVRALGGPMGPAMLRMMQTTVGKRMVHSMISGFTHRGKSLSIDATDAHWHALREGGTAAQRSFAQNLGSFTAEFPRYAEALRRIDVPATIIWGTKDPVLRPEVLVHRFVDDLRIAPADVHLLESASHFLQEDRPDEVADLIIRFVSHHIDHPAAVAPTEVAPTTVATTTRSIA